MLTADVPMNFFVYFFYSICLCSVIASASKNGLRKGFRDMDLTGGVSDYKSVYADSLMKGRGLYRQTVLEPFMETIRRQRTETLGRSGFLSPSERELSKDLSEADQECLWVGINGWGESTRDEWIILLLRQIRFCWMRGWKTIHVSFCWCRRKLDHSSRKIELRRILEKQRSENFAKTYEVKPSLKH